MQNSESLNYLLKQLNTSYSHFISGSFKQQLTVYLYNYDQQTNLDGLS